jgi:gliding motility-associated-like protein
MKKVLLLFILFFSLHTYAQKEANFWYFGQNAALDFNSGVPVSVTGSALSTREGCSSFSDANGNLLFYVGAPTTNAQNLTIWNRNNVSMPFTAGATKLNGDASSSQSALTVPVPGTTDEYFLFTVGAQSSSNAGFWYYTVNMRSDAGLGDVTAGPVALNHTFNEGNWTEKVTAVRADACNTFWVISLIGNSFLSYQVDGSGVAAIPVVSTIPGFFNNDPRGYLKVSPDGKTLVAASMGSGTFIFNFDDVTGTVSNYEDPNNASQINLLGRNGYGVEFSPTSRVLYVSTGNFTPTQEFLYQFDLTQTTLADINASRYEVHSYANTRGAVQLGPDNKIYWTSNDSPNISVVNQPEELGVDCDYSHLSVNLGGPLASQGLPPFLSSLLLPIDITDTATGQTINNQTLQYCVGDSKTLTPDAVVGNNITYEWTFDDGSGPTFLTDTQSLTLTNMTAANGGAYSLTIKLTDNCGNLTELNGVFNIGIFDPPLTIDSTVVPDIQFCDTDGDGLNQFDFTALSAAILGAQNPADFDVVYSTVSDFATLIPDATAYQNSAPFSTDTMYVRIRNNRAPDACYNDDSFTIQVTSEPTPVNPVDYVLCDNTSVGTDIDGVVSDFVLSNKDAEILGTLDPTLYTVSYHSSSADAQNNASPLDKVNPYTNTAFTETIHVRVENNLNTACDAFSVADQTAAFNSFDLVVVPQPKTDPATNILACSSTGFETFDLAALKDAEVLGTQSNTTFNVVYYPTQADAQADMNRLPTPNAYTNLSAYSTDTIWSRVFHTAYPTTCTDVNQAITSFQIFVTQDPDGLIQTPTDVSACDNAIGGGTDTDGIINDFIVLSTKDAEILNNAAIVNTALYTVSYHLTGADATGDANPIDKINPYTNATANQQTIYVRVEHNDNATNCVAFTDFDLIVHPLPVIATPQEIRQCDADANPNDGFSFFNLTEANSLFSTNHANETFEYYGSQTGAQNATASELINTPTSFQNRTVSTDTVWARIINNNGCFRVGQLNLISSTSAIPNVITHRFNVCDDFDGTPGSDTDGTTVFDFSSVDAQIRALFPQAVEVSYYQNEADSAIENAPITNTSSFRNTLANTVGGRQIIWVRVESTLNEDCLGRSGYIELIIDPIPVANPVTDLELCDDFQDGNGTNGFVQSFDLESQTATILGTQNPANYAVTYHISNADASTGANPLSSPFTNTIAGGQEIFVRVTNTNNPATTNQCVTYHTSFNVVVNPLPIANAVPDLEVCDDAADGSPTNGFAQGINLEVQTPGILGTQDPNQFTVTYHGTLAEAQAGIVPLVSNNFSNSVQNRQTIWVRVYNSVTQCANGISNFDVIVNPEPVFTAVSTLEYCDNDDNGEDDTDGIIVGDIDLTQQTERLIDPAGTGQVLADFTVTYYTSQADATAGMNAIADPSNFTNTVPRRQTIYVRIQNNITGCANDEAFFDVVVNPLPDFQVTTPQIVCLNGPNLTIRVENPADTYDYVWTDPNGNNIVGSFLTISSGGLYSITATMTDGTNCSRTRTIQVNESIIATITQDDVTIVDDSDNNSITIDPTNLGIGDYEYALTDQNNVFVRSYQDSPLFERLEGGFYNILVRDKNGCGEVSLLVSVVEFPKFFTPNNDGINDTWIVKGANSTFFPTSSIYIFNRYGKVVANIPIDSQGWNGSYGGNNLPSDDYWFAIKLVDQQGITRERKGNFSLLRK